MTTQKLIIACLSFCFLFWQGCGGSSGTEGNAKDASGQSAAENGGGASGEPKNIEEAMSEVQKALQGDGEKKEVVDFRELKKLLPEKLAGLERTAHSGEKAGAMGFNMSTAKAEYRDGDKELEAVIVDFAGVGAALMGMAAWATVEIDREDENGYERTTTVEGYKAFEKYNSRNKSGELSVLVGERFIVTLKGRNIEEADFKKAIGQLEVRKLANME